MSYDLYIADLQEKERLQDEDILILEDEENTKRISFTNLILSLIKDSDAPASYRIWSAEKIQQLINKIDTVYGQDINKLKSSTKDLEDDKATRDELQTLKEELLDSFPDGLSMEDIENLINNKMPKDYKIKSSDMDSSSDESKIKLGNLSQEVIDAITGKTPVSSNRAPEGGWVTEDIADSAIVANKLASNFRYRGSLEEGDVNELLRDGYYVVSADVLNLPIDSEYPDDTRLVDVERVNDNIIIQTVYYTENFDEKPIYKRRGSVQQLSALRFVRFEDLSSSNKISSSLLSDEYNVCELSSGKSLSDIYKEGNYKVPAGTVGMPDSKNKFYLKARNYGEKCMIYTAYNMDISNCDIYVCLRYRQSNGLMTNTEWYPIVTKTRSKFEGSRVTLFGDANISLYLTGVNTGKKVSDLLSSKYGFIIQQNCATSNGLAASYGRSDKDKYTLYEQIIRTDLSNSEYAIINIGSTDYAQGLGSLYKNGEDYKLSTDNFRGGLNLAIKTILETNPKIKILLITPIYRNSISDGDNHNSDDTAVNGYTLQDYTDTILEVGKTNHIPVLDMTASGMINRYNWETYLVSADKTGKGVLLNEKGCELFADKIFSSMSTFY